MKHEVGTEDITLLIEQARPQRNHATGARIADGSREMTAWLLAKADAFLHHMLMSPVPDRKIVKEN